MGGNSELHALMGMIFALVFCSAPHAARIVKQANPSDATIGYWLLRAYFVCNAAWITVFVIYTRGDPTKDKLVAAAHVAIGDMPGGLTVHMWLPLIGAAVSLAAFSVCKFTDPGIVTVRLAHHPQRPLAVNRCLSPCLLCLSCREATHACCAIGLGTATERPAAARSAAWRRARHGLTTAEPAASA